MGYAILLIIILPALVCTRSDNNTFKRLMLPHRLARLIRLKEKVQIAISQNSLRRQIFSIIPTSQKTTARPSGRFNDHVNMSIDSPRYRIRRKLDTFRLESDSPFSNLYIRCFLGAIQLSACLIYLINTRGNVQSPAFTGKPLPPILLLYVRWLSRGIKTESSMLSVAPKASTFAAQTPSRN